MGTALILACAWLLALAPGHAAAEDTDMKRVETPGFSIEAPALFESVRSLASSVLLKRDPETIFSPQMSVWAGDPDKRVSAQAWLTNALADGEPVIERKAVTMAGMSGEMAKVKGRLADEAGTQKDWFRLRALLVAPEGAGWFHATAMASADDLQTVETAFLRLLGSIRVTLAGEAARAARADNDAEMDRMLSLLRRKLAQEREPPQAGAKSQEARPAAPVADVETRFDKALAAADLRDRRDILRRIAAPSLSLTELGEAPRGQTGLSRIGGGPDLPQGLDWPRDASGFHLNFLAQINLADLPAPQADLPGPLPAGGLLSFFSGTDYSDWRVIHIPAGATLVHHALPPDAEETAIAAMRMVTWDSDRKRFVADGAGAGGLDVATGADGRMSFNRAGRPVIALASEYEISRSSQALRIEPSLTAPFGLPGDGSQVYCEAGLDDPSLFWEAIGKAFAIGEGPQHQMFGVTGVREFSELQRLAADHARQQGWSEITAPDGWFILVKLASGGEAGFSFSDHGDYVFMAHRQDAAKGDFSRIYAFVESG